MAKIGRKSSCKAPAKKSAPKKANKFACGGKKK